MNVRHSATGLYILLLFIEFSFVIFKVKDLRPGGTDLSVVRKVPLNRPKSFDGCPIEFFVFYMLSTPGSLINTFWLSSSNSRKC